MDVPGAATGGDALAKCTYIDRCNSCGARLQIIDDLAANADISQSFRGCLGEAFVVVPSSDPEELSFPNHDSDQPPFEEVSRMEQIMALASGQTEADHPVCHDCLTKVVAEVQRKVDEAEAEHRYYQEAATRLQERMHEFSDEEAQRLEAELAEMEAEERELLQELRGFDEEERQLQEDLARHRRQEEQLQREEDEFWRSFARHQLDLEEGEEEQALTSSAVRYATSELARLKRTNVLNDMFHIAPLDQFGTINRFRMGRLPETPVPWEEINAAWGQACLLLDAIIKRCGTPPMQHRLLPRGSFSAIQVGGQVYPLYSNEGGIKSFFQNRDFDLAMAAFLECLKDVTRFLQRNPSVRLPFKIEGDKVAGFSVRSLFNQGERWTKALKYMLTDLKWIIAFVESREVGDRGGPSSNGGGGG